MNIQDYPDEVQEAINVFSLYVENDDLALFNIVHLYKTEIAYPNGYYDSMFFDLVLFNTRTMEKRTLKSRDGITLKNVASHEVRIFADGSTMIKFHELVGIRVFQHVTIGRA
jgi:hypothetical protein